MKKLLLFGALFYSSLAFGQTQIDFHTTKGDFRAEVREDLMPITAGNFIDLVAQKFYNGVIFHRVVAGFVIQGGDPTSSGSGGPGYTILDEYHPQMNHDSAGVLAMAKSSAPNSAGSQFYFTLAPQPSLDQNYAVFGSCIQGLSVIQAIGLVATQGNDRPWFDVVMDSVRVVENVSSVKQADFSVKTEIFPNPFLGNTSIQYEVKTAGQVEISIFDAQGQLIEIMVNETQSSGIHQLDWTTAKQGLYFLHIKTTDGIGVRRLIAQ